MAARLTQFQNDLIAAQHIGLDTMCFIYQFADDPIYSPLTHQCFSLLESRKVTAVTSTITVSELFVLPEKYDDRALISEYEKIFKNFPGLTISPVDWPVARLAAALRAHYPTIRIPDALGIATALYNKCTLFLTNDEKLRQVKEIRIKILKDYVL